MPTALEYIYDCAARLGKFAGSLSTTSAGTTSTLICSTFDNSSLAATELGNFAVLIESGACAGQMGFVTPTGLDRSTGTITTADEFTTAIASGVVFSLYDGTRLPPLRKGLTPGLLQKANDALGGLWVEDTLTVAGVTSQIHYTVDTTTYPWFTDDTRIIEIQNPVTNSDHAPSVLPRSSWSWVSDGETRKLRFPGAPFNTGQDFTIKVNRPAKSRIRRNGLARATIGAGAVTAITVVQGEWYTVTPTVTISGGGGTGATATATISGGGITSIAVTAGGSGYTTVPTVTISSGEWKDIGTQTAGLVTVFDEAIPDLRFMRPQMLALSYEALAAMNAPGATVAEWMAKAQIWEGNAIGMKRRRLQRDPTEGVIRLQPRRSVVR
jgi:hypothetical protein